MGSFGNFSPLSPSPQVSRDKRGKAAEKAEKKTAPELNRDLIESGENSEKSMTEAGDGIPILKLKRFEFPPSLHGGGTSIPASLHKSNFDLVPGGTPRLVSNQLMKS